MVPAGCTDCTPFPAKISPRLPPVRRISHVPFYSKIAQFGTRTCHSHSFKHGHHPGRRAPLLASCYAQQHHLHAITCPPHLLISCGKAIDFLCLNRRLRKRLENDAPFCSDECERVISIHPLFYANTSLIPGELTSDARRELLPS